MNSRIIGEASIVLPQTELNAMLQFAGENEDYSEFHYGDWKTFVIWSQSGADNDGLVIDRGVSGKPTPRAAALPALLDWIGNTFDTTLLKLGRIHSLGDGVLIPHRDFVEFGEDRLPWTRVHVPLHTNEQCLHSEDETVFRMRAGEIWFLDASNLHSAINFSNDRRLNLCLDFALDGQPIESVFRRTEALAVQHSPEIVSRAAMQPSFSRELAELGAALTEENFRDTVGTLAKVHFRSDVHIATFYDWLETVAERSGSAELRDKAGSYCRFLRAERDMGQRFDAGD
jgi:hypothetical protein